MSSRPRLSDSAGFRALVGDARSRHNLSAIIGRHTELKPRGNSRKEQHGCCPFHSERSPSFEVNDEKGTYHCWGCGAAGDAITFLTAYEGLSFLQAVETLSGDKFPTISEDERAKRKAADQRELAERIDCARSVWKRAVPAEGTPAEVYARSRGITLPLPPTVRFVMTPRWRNSDTGEVGRDHPAMACALQDVGGRVVGVQCVFLQNGGREKFARTYDDGKQAKAKLSFGVIAGSALRLGPIADEIIFCEGPEDGLTLAQQLPGQSVWVTCGTAMLSRVDLPEAVRAITLAGDNNAPGRKAVADARAAYLGQGRSVREVFPDPAFKDWNDELRGVCA